MVDRYVEVFVDVENTKVKKELAVSCRKALFQRSLLESGQIRYIYVGIVGDQPEIGMEHGTLPEYNSAEISGHSLMIVMMTTKWTHTEGNLQL
jgi:hypothetical protein